jgi:four helix bundle protein
MGEWVNFGKKMVWGADNFDFLTLIYNYSLKNMKMGTLRTHFDLEVWKKSIELVKETYLVTKAFPTEERYGLTQQMRRAAISVPSNIAEGAARKSSKEFIQFLYIALGSLTELETQFIISKELDFIDSNEAYLKMIKSIKVMLRGLIRSLEAKK